MLAQRTLKMPSETDKIYLHKELNPLPRNAANGQARRFLRCVRPLHNTAKQMVKYPRSDWIECT